MISLLLDVCVVMIVYSLILGCFVFCFFVLCFFFFMQRPAYGWRISDWSSDVCSSDLLQERQDPRFPCGRVAAVRSHVSAVGRHPELAPSARACRSQVVRVVDVDGRVLLAVDEEEGLVGQRLDLVDGAHRGQRSEERRVGKEGVSTGRSRWSPDT